MAIPHFPRRRRLRTLMIVVAACAVGLGADRGPVDRLIEQLRAGDARARSEAAIRIGLLGRRASFAIRALDSALDPPLFVQSPLDTNLTRWCTGPPGRIFPTFQERRIVETSPREYL